MKLKVFLIWIFSLFTATGFAQKSGTKMVYRKADSIARAFVSCGYSYVVKLKGRSDSVNMILQIGKSISKFEGMDEFRDDSLSLALGNKKYPVSFLLDKVNSLNLSNSSSINWRLYSNYPQGYITTCERISTDHYKSVEPIHQIKWHIDFDSTKNVMGYNCQKATAEIYGRKWVAWFTKEIPYPQGPWLVQGLPGLVVQAYDTKKEQDFLLFAVKKVDTPICMVASDYFNSPRKTVIKLKLRYYSNRGKMIANSGLVTSVDGKPVDNAYTPDEDPLKYYNPLRIYPTK